MPPSSIFSSRNRARPREAAKAWIATGIVLACVEGALRFGLDDLYGREPESYDGHFRAVEEQVLRHGPAAEVLVMGDSRAMVAVMPTLLEAELLRHGRKWRVANLGVMAGTPYDMWRLIQRNPRPVGKAKHLIYFVEPLPWSKAGRVDSMGKWSDLIRAHGIGGVKHALFKTYSARAHLKDLVVDRWRGVAPVASAPDSYGRLVSFAVSERGPSEYPQRAVERRARRLLSNYEPKEFQIEYFLRIAAWCQANRVNLILLQLPKRPEFDAVLRSGYADAISRYDALLGDLEARGHRVVKLSRRQLALAPEDFHDADHLANSGARKSTRFVAAHLLGARAASAQ